MNSPGAKVPNLFIVGAPKCGTTAWAEYLGSHPDIFVPPYKDNCYFAHDLPNFRLVRSAADYAAQFVEGDHARIVGEASAGSNGDPTVVPLPGGFRLQFSGLKDIGTAGGTIQGRGVIPDLAVTPTRRSYLDGHDAVLEAALTYIRSRGPAAERH